jgi:hypothetical protein
MANSLCPKLQRRPLHSCCIRSFQYMLILLQRRPIPSTALAAACDNFETPTAGLITIFNDNARTSLRAGCSPHHQHPRSIYQRNIYHDNANSRPAVYYKSSGSAHNTLARCYNARGQRGAARRHTYAIPTQVMWTNIPYDMHTLIRRGLARPAHPLAEPTSRRVFDGRLVTLTCY